MLLSAGPRLGPVNWNGAWRTPLTIPVTSTMAATDRPFTRRWNVSKVVVISARCRHRIHPELLWPQPPRPWHPPIDHIPGVGVFRKCRGDLCQMASSHPPRAAAAVPPDREFFLFILFFDFRRRPRALRNVVPGRDTQLGTA
jgi:hypothetical protein